MTSGDSSRVDCLVVGGGLAGLLAAYDAARAGKTVQLFEAAKHCGGAISSIDIAGVRIDSGAESFATTRPETLALIEELGLSEKVVTPARSDARIYSQGNAYLIPHGMMGIPSDLSDPHTIAILGSDAAQEAALLDSAPWNITDEKTLGAVVAKRMGAAVVEKIVNPIVAGVHASDSYLLEMESLVPGLLAKARELGSLHVAVRELRGGASRPGSAVAGIAGGMNLLTRALYAKLLEHGVKISQESAVTKVSRQSDGSWMTITNNQQVRSTYLVLATNPVVARNLLKDFPVIADLLAPITPIDVALVIMAVRAKRLEQVPLGSGILIAQAEQMPVVAKASTHASAKWEWVKNAAGDFDIVRFSYGRNGVVDPSDENLLKAAASDLVAIYGVEHPEIIEARVVRWPQSLMQAQVGHQDNLKKIRETLTLEPTLRGLAIVGSGVSGNGIAGVIGRTRHDMKGLLNV